MLDVFDPWLNLRDIAKEMLLLEMHLKDPERHCDDCISKHILTVEGLAEEALSLDKTGRLHGLCHQLAEVARVAWHQVFVESTPPQGVLQWIRRHRKPLVGLLRQRSARSGGPGSGLSG